MRIGYVLVSYSICIWYHISYCTTYESYDASTPYYVVIRIIIFSEYIIMYRMIALDYSYFTSHSSRTVGLQNSLVS